MRDNIMFIPACILMIVEALAVGFLVWSWCDAKRRDKEKVKNEIECSSKRLD